MYVFISNTQIYVYKYKHYIYFHAYIAIYIIIKVNIIHIFHMNIHQHHHIFRERFVYFHTFFHSKIMCSCRLITCLYDIRQTSYERRLHHSRVATSEPIWAEFISAICKICPWLIRAATPVLSHAASPRLYIGIYYWGKFVWHNLHTRTWEKFGSIFSRRASICTVYCWEKCKKCKVTYARGFFTSIYYFIWIKCNWKNMAIGNRW